MIDPRDRADILACAAGRSLAIQNSGSQIEFLPSPGLSGCQVAFLRFFDQLGCNPAQGQRIAWEGHQQGIVERPLPVHGADRPSHHVLHRYYRWTCFLAGSAGGGEKYRFGTHYIFISLPVLRRLRA